MTTAIHKQSMFQDVTVWSMIVVSILTYCMSSVPYNTRMEGYVKKEPRHSSFMLIWALLFVLYTIASILSYRAVTALSEDDEDDKNNACNMCHTTPVRECSSGFKAQDVSKVMFLMFLLTMIFIMGWSYAHCIMGSYFWMSLLSFLILGALGVQMILGWCYVKEQRWTVFLILPLFVWILIFGMGWSAVKSLNKSMMLNKLAL